MAVPPRASVRIVMTAISRPDLDHRPPPSGPGSGISISSLPSGRTECMLRNVCVASLKRENRRRPSIVPTVIDGVGDAVGDGVAALLARGVTAALLPGGVAAGAPPDRADGDATGDGLPTAVHAAIVSKSPATTRGTRRVDKTCIAGLLTEAPAWRPCRSSTSPPLSRSATGGSFGLR
jgi:hypothetical protein